MQAVPLNFRPLFKKEIAPFFSPIRISNRISASFSFLPPPALLITFFVLDFPPYLEKERRETWSWVVSSFLTFRSASFQAFIGTGFNLVLAFDTFTHSLHPPERRQLDFEKEPGKVRTYRIDDAFPAYFRRGRVILRRPAPLAQCEVQLSTAQCLVKIRTMTLSFPLFSPFYSFFLLAVERMDDDVVCMNAFSFASPAAFAFFPFGNISLFSG